MILKTFGWSFLFTVFAIGAAALYGGITGAVVAVILIVLEISFSFDNAVVNAKILERMSEWWQRIFLTVGVFVAVFGMRLVFPLLVVGITAKLSPSRAWELAMEKGDPDVPGTYGYILHEAHPAIAAFGGMFLLMIFLDWLIDPDKELHWIDPLERALQKIHALERAAILIASVVLVAVTLVFREDAEQILLSGIIGLVSYMAVSGLGEYFENSAEDDAAPATNGEMVVATGKAAFFLFIYLEMLDASFSFDGVIGAFAITSDPIIIALGLGVGALYVRSLTIYLVRQGTLSEYVFLEHGAHWAIGVLAVILLVTIGHEVPEVVTGLIGVGFIAAAFLWSLRHNRLAAEAEASADSTTFVG